MQVVQIPAGSLAAEIRAGHVSLFRMAGQAATGRLGGVIDAVADRGLKKAGQDSTGAGLAWPDSCCKCLSKGARPVRSESIVNRGVAYVFRFSIPHCNVCAGSANRKRTGMMGLIAVWLVAAFCIGFAMMFFGAATERNWLINSALLGGPLGGVLVAYAWQRLRTPDGRRGSAYQAVYASSIEVSGSGTPTSFCLAFENPAYASRFVTLNSAAGVRVADVG